MREVKFVAVPVRDRDAALSFSTAKPGEMEVMATRGATGQDATAIE